MELELDTSCIFRRRMERARRERRQTAPRRHSMGKAGRDQQSYQLTSWINDPDAKWDKGGKRFVENMINPTKGTQTLSGNFLLSSAEKKKETMVLSKVLMCVGVQVEESCFVTERPRSETQAIWADKYQKIKRSGSKAWENSHFERHQTKRKGDRAWSKRRVRMRVGWKETEFWSLGGGGWRPVSDCGVPPNAPTKAAFSTVTDRWVNLEWRFQGTLGKHQHPEMS